LPAPERLALVFALLDEGLPHLLADRLDLLGRELDLGQLPQELGPLVKRAGHVGRRPLHQKPHRMPPFRDLELLVYREKKKIHGVFAPTAGAAWPAVFLRIGRDRLASGVFAP